MSRGRQTSEYHPDQMISRPRPALASIGGTVTIEIHPDWESYEGSDSNGITTLDYGSWPGSFVILSD